jgi:phosphatidylinositol alpha-1,6-mannosyltransferase
MSHHARQQHGQSRKNRASSQVEIAAEIPRRGIKRKILLITRNLPPLIGGMERLNWHMADELSRDAEVCVIGPLGSAALAPAGVRVVEIPLRPLWRFLAHSLWHGVREARRWQPDLVLAGSGLTALPAWISAKLSAVRCATYAHGLDIAVRHPLYRALWLPALRRMDRVIVNSRSTSSLAKAAGVQPKSIGIVYPGVEVPKTLPDAQAVSRFRAEYDLGERPVLLSVGRLTARKGISEFVTHALPRIVETRPDALLLIVGDAPADALRADAQSPASIRDAAERVGMGDRLRFFGTVTDYAKLGTIYRSADVHVFPVRELSGDPEGFGMVAVEAAVHGLPSVAFATGGVADAVADGSSGRLIAPGDYTGFAQAVLDVLASAARWENACRKFGERFAWPTFGRALRSNLGPI